MVAFEIAARSPMLAERHARALLMPWSPYCATSLVKGDEAWVRGGARGELELARDTGDSWTIPPSVRPHAYRMSAFGQVASDLGGL